MGIASPTASQACAASSTPAAKLMDLALATRATRRRRGKRSVSSRWLMRAFVCSQGCGKGGRVLFAARASWMLEGCCRRDLRDNSGSTSALRHSCDRACLRVASLWAACLRAAIYQKLKRHLCRLSCKLLGVIIALVLVSSLLARTPRHRLCTASTRWRATRPNWPGLLA